MRVLVAVKRTIDPNVRARIKSDGSEVELANVKMAMNPFDEIAVEEAVRIKEKGAASELVAVSIGTTACQETLRSALALGCDRAILVQAENELDPLAIAKILRAIAEKEQARLIVMGKQAIDDDSGQVGQMLAGLLNWAQGTFASKVELEGERVKVTREIDGGLETLMLTLPSVITTDLRLNTPRYASLPNIMKAKKKPLEVVPLAQLELDVAPRTRNIKVSEPEKRAAGVRVANVKELVKRLREDARVI
jgi:electron transfer flavoprotein beta subunit